MLSSCLGLLVVFHKSFHFPSSDEEILLRALYPVLFYILYLVFQIVNILAVRYLIYIAEKAIYLSPKSIFLNIKWHASAVFKIKRKIFQINVVASDWTYCFSHTWLIVFLTREMSIRGSSLAKNNERTKIYYMEMQRVNLDMYMIKLYIIQ